MIFGETREVIIGKLGIALLQVKNERRLHYDDMEKVMDRKEDMIRRYILGDAEMGIVAFALALNAWPELVAKMEALP